MAMTLILFLSKASVFLVVTAFLYNGLKMFYTAAHMIRLAAFCAFPKQRPDLLDSHSLAIRLFEKYFNRVLVLTVVLWVQAFILFGDKFFAYADMVFIMSCFK